MNTDKFSEIAICPHCKESLSFSDDGTVCTNCQREYERTGSGIPDLRLQEPETVSLSYQLRPSGIDPPNDDLLRPLEYSSEKQTSTSLGGSDLSERDRKLLSYLPEPTGESPIAVELGTIQRRYQTYIEEMGYEYVGIDIGSIDPSVKADARAIPIEDDSVDVVVSIAMLEHVSHPRIAVREIHRILKPGGTFFGSMAFLNPYHGESKLHATHYGLYYLLAECEFEIEWLSPDEHGLYNLSEWGLFRPLRNVLPAKVVKLPAAPLVALHKLWYRIWYAVTGNEDASEMWNSFKHTSMVNFLAMKRED